LKRLKKLTQTVPVVQATEAPVPHGMGADDAIDALAVQLLRDEGEAQLLSDCTGEEASHRVLLPSRLLHDRRRPLGEAGGGRFIQSGW
jgi:hypothetical protein